MSRPAMQYCPLHTDQLPTLTFHEGADVEWEFCCNELDHGPTRGPRRWPAPVETVDLGEALGLDLRSTLPQAVGDASEAAGGGWVEYGLVERAWAKANAEDFSMLLVKYDHRYFHGTSATRATLPYTASKYLAGRLGALSRLGDVLYQDGKGTGYWSYLSSVSYWAPTHVIDLSQVTTFADAGAQMTDYMPDQRPN